MNQPIDRRRMLRGAALLGGGAALAAWTPAWARQISRGLSAPLPSVSGEDIRLEIAWRMAMIDGQPFRAIGINGTTPGPLTPSSGTTTARASPSVTP